MTDEVAGLGPAALALIDPDSQRYAELDPAQLRDGVVELAAAQESTYLTYEMLEIDIAVVRVLRLEITDVDDRLVDWFADRPSPARLGPTCWALWQLWSPVNPHPAIDPATVRRLIAAAAGFAIGSLEVGAYRAALGFAARQIDDPATRAAIDQELTRLDAVADPG